MNFTHGRTYPKKFRSWSWGVSFSSYRNLPRPDNSRVDRIYGRNHRDVYISLGGYLLHWQWNFK